LKTWVTALDKNDINHEHHLLEALWTHQFHDVVNLDLLDGLLTAHDFHARAAAARVPGELLRRWTRAWGSGVPDASVRHGDYLGQALHDELKGHRDD